MMNDRRVDSRLEYANAPTVFRMLRVDAMAAPSCSAHLHESPEPFFVAFRNAAAHYLGDGDRPVTRQE